MDLYTEPPLPCIPNCRHPNWHPKPAHLLILTNMPSLPFDWLSPLNPSRPLVASAQYTQPANLLYSMSNTGLLPLPNVPMQPIHCLWPVCPASTNLLFSCLDIFTLAATPALHTPICPFPVYSPTCQLSTPDAYPAHILPLASTLSQPVKLLLQVK